MSASIESFLELDIRSGTILEAAPFPKAKKPAYKLRIDFGNNIGVKNSSAQITFNYSPEQLKGMQVMAVVNFPARKIADFISEVLVLGCVDNTGTVVLITPERKIENGLRLA